MKSKKGDLTNQAILSEEAVGGIQSASQAVFGSGWVSLGTPLGDISKKCLADISTANIRDGAGSRTIKAAQHGASCHWCNPLKTRGWLWDVLNVFFLNRDISFFRYSSAKASNRELVDASMTRPGEIIFPLIHSKYVSNPESKIESWTPGNYGRNMKKHHLQNIWCQL